MLFPNFYVARLWLFASCFLLNATYSFSINSNSVSPQGDTVLVNRLLLEARNLEIASQHQKALLKTDSAEWALQPVVTDADSLLLAQIYHLRGNNYYRLRNYDAAVGFYEKAKSIRLRKLGNDHFRVGDTWYMIGNVHFDLNEFQSARMAYGHAMNIYANLPLPDSNKIASCWFAMGNIADDQDSLQQAKFNFERSLDFLNENNPRHERQIATTNYVLASSCMRSGELERAEKLLDNAYRIVAKNPEQYLPLLAAVWNEKSWLEFNKGNYEAGLKSAQEGLSIYRNIFGEDSPELVPFYLNVGNAFNNKGDLAGAEESFQEGLSLCKNSNLPRDQFNAASCYGSLANIYGKLEDHEKALEYHQHALAVFSKLSDLPSNEKAVTYMNIGITYKNLTRYPESLENLSKASQLYLQTTGGKSIDLARNWSNISNVLWAEGKLQSAIDTVEAAIALVKKIVGKEEHDEIGRYYLDLGHLYQSAGDYEKALKHFAAAETILTKTVGPNHPVVAHNLGLTFETLGKQGEFEKGEPLIQKTLDLLNYTGNTTLSLQGVKNAVYVVESLFGKGEFYEKWFFENSNAALLKKSNEAFEEALAVLENFRRTILTPGSKIQLSEKYYGIYEGCLRTAILLQTKQDSLRAFEVTERSKTQILRETMQAADATQNAGVPAFVLAEEQQLKLQITALELAKFELLNSSTPNLIWMDTLNHKLFNAYAHQKNFFLRLEKEYPPYFEAKYDLKVAPVAAVQSVLSKDETLLEYFVGDSSIFIFTVNKDSYRVFEIKKDFPLETWVHQLLDGLKIKGQDATLSAVRNGWQQYSILAHRIYEKLIAPVAGHLNERIVIVPDGILSYLPFEVLLTTKAEAGTLPQKYPYWIREKTLSYALSANLFWRNRREMVLENSLPETCLAMAPFSQSGDEKDIAARTNFQPLPHSAEEATTVYAMIGNGKIALGAEATVGFFQQNVAQHAVLLLSTHGKADRKVGNYSYLAFSDRLYYVREVFALEIHADMVILSACETAVGQLRRGEGIIGMAYAFSYAGARSVFATLWQVQDKAAFELSSGFFNHIFNQKQEKYTALRQVKLALIANEATAHPYFWAAMIGFGDMRTP